MDWPKSGNMIGFAALIVAVFVGIVTLSAGLMVGLSPRLIGFRVPFKGAFQAVLATIVVTMFIRGIGGKVDELVGYGVGSALTLIGVIYFLAWYLDRHVPRPDGTPLGRGDAYFLAGVHALVMVVVSALAYTLIGTMQ